MRLGGCQCGAIRFSSEGEAETLFICHCRECQKQSDSAFGMSPRVPRPGLTILSGQPKVWSRAIDSLYHPDCVLCSTCGSRSRHESSAAPEMVSIKVGCLDLPVDILDATHIRTTRKLPGVTIPKAPNSFRPNRRSKAGSLGTFMLIGRP
jgi:hypothetical protein